jgi:hypothetical protein
MEDNSAFLHIGHFHGWYGQVEWRLTMLMAFVAEERDFAAFHVLTMDAKTKVIRFIRLCKIKNRKIGPLLLSRLAHYRDNMAEFRNKISHTALARNDDQTRFLLASLGTVSLDEINNKIWDKAESFSDLDLYERGLWLNYFADDLWDVFPKVGAGAILELENPNSWERWVPHSNYSGPNSQTTSHTHAPTPPETQDSYQRP